MTAVWERRADEGESEKAYAAFTVFRDMGAGERSIKVAAQRIGKQRTLLTRWARQWDWQARVAAYDAHMDRQMLIIREVGLQDYARGVNSALQVKLAALDEIVSNEIVRMRKMQQDGEEINGLTLRRLISAVGEADALARRSAGMPTAYRSETAPAAKDGESEIYLIGGNDTGEDEAEEYN